MDLGVKVEEGRGECVWGLGSHIPTCITVAGVGSRGKQRRTRTTRAHVPRCPAFQAIEWSVPTCSCRAALPPRPDLRLGRRLASVLPPTHQRPITMLSLTGVSALPIMNPVPRLGWKIQQLGLGGDRGHWSKPLRGRLDGGRPGGGRPGGGRHLSCRQSTPQPNRTLRLAVWDQPRILSPSVPLCNRNLANQKPPGRDNPCMCQLLQNTVRAAGPTSFTLPGNCTNTSGCP